MQKLFLCLILSLLFTPTQAQEQGVLYNAQIVIADRAPSKRLLSQADWSQFLQKSKGTILEEIGGAVKMDTPSLVHPGIKNPIPYKDPRPNMYQVQYVDIGMKLDITTKNIGNGLMKILARTERSVLDPHPDLDSRTAVVIFETETVAKRGQVAIVGVMSGPLALKNMKKQFPNLSLKETDTLLMTVTVK